MKGVLEEAVKRGAEATLVVSESRRTDVSFDFNRLKNVEDTESFGLSLQVIRDGKLGVSNSTRVGGEKELLEKALSVAEFGSSVSYRFPEPEPHANPRLFHPEVAGFELDDMISLGDELVGFIKSLDPAINGSAGISRNVTEKTIANTRGLSASWKKTSFFVSAGFQFVEGQNLLQSWDWDVSSSVRYDLERIKAKIKEDFRYHPPHPGVPRRPRRDEGDQSVQGPHR